MDLEGRRAARWRWCSRGQQMLLAAVGTAVFVLFALTAEVNDARRRVALADVLLLGLLAVATAMSDEGQRRPLRWIRS